jgi:hypothetical protein
MKVISDYTCDKCHRNMDIERSVKQKLLITERNILRRIFGRTKERDGIWRIKTNDEVNKLIKNKNIINYINAQRL